MILKVQNESDFIVLVWQRGTLVVDLSAGVRKGEELINVLEGGLLGLLCHAWVISSWTITIVLVMMSGQWRRTMVAPASLSTVSS